MSLTGEMSFIKCKLGPDVQQEVLECSMFPSAEKHYGDADFILQQDLTSAQTTKKKKKHRPCYPCT